MLLNIQTFAYYHYGVILNNYYKKKVVTKEITLSLLTLIRLYHDYVALRENTMERSGVLEIGARSAPDL